MSEQIRPMSDEELSRAIAEAMEPLSTLPSEDDCDHAVMEAFPTQCWLATFRLSQVTGMHVPSWQPRDMVNDPAMTVMLLEQLKQEDILVNITLSHWKDGRWSQWKVELEHGFTEHEHLGRAVAEAWLLARGQK